MFWQIFQIQILASKKYIQTLLHLARNYRVVSTLRGVYSDQEKIDLHPQFAILI